MAEINNNMNVYGYNEDNSIYTWLEETRDWRKHEHEHLEAAKEEINTNIEEAKDSINEQVKTSEQNIKNEITEAREYVVNIISPKIEEVSKKADENNSLLNTIWNKIKNMTGIQ